MKAMSFDGGRVVKSFTQGLVAHGVIMLQSLLFLGASPGVGAYGNRGNSIDLLYIGDSLSVGLEREQESFLGPKVFSELSQRGWNLEFHAFGGSRPHDWYWREEGREAPILVSHRFRQDSASGVPQTKKISGDVVMSVSFWELLQRHRPEKVVVQLGTNLLPVFRDSHGNLKTGVELEQSRQAVRHQVAKLLSFLSDSQRCFWILPPHAREVSRSDLDGDFYRKGYSIELQQELRAAILEAIEGRCEVFESLDLSWLRRLPSDQDPLHYGRDLSTRWGAEVWPWLMSFE